jgi:polyhydroxyalkanoate synthesis regulator phasin
MPDFSFSQETTDEGVSKGELEYEYDLSENVVEDLIRFGRSGIVKNEQQFQLTSLGYTTGFMEQPSHYVCGVLIGTAGSGKSHIQNVVEELYDEGYMYQATSGSDTSIIYDDTWEDAYIASLDELQKPSDDIIEVLKSCFSEDTDVLTPKGVVNITDLTIGDEVYSWNPNSDEVEVKEVVDTIEQDDTRSYCVY